MRPTVSFRGHQRGVVHSPDWFGKCRWRRVFPDGSGFRHVQDALGENLKRWLASSQSDLRLIQQSEDEIEPWIPTLTDEEYLVVVCMPDRIVNVICLLDS